MKSFFTDFSKISLKHFLLPMGATIFCLLVCLPQISAQGIKQTELTISVDNAPIANVLSIIEKQSSYRFIYNSDLKALQQKVTLNVKSSLIKDLLNNLFNKTDLVYTLMENNMIVINEIAQNNYADDDRIVNGKVTGDGGIPLAGVSVQIKGTNKGITTKSNGEFYISVSDSDVLIFSYVGYETQEISVAGKLTINVSLISRKEDLTQVVVVGYGTQRKIDVTGATASVKGSELSKQPVMTATQALQGKVAGVQIISSGQPGSSPVVRIRGTGTALAGTNVLFVVDGVLTDDISNINTDDITNVDILKDASSTAIYGSRGANGVMIITTKKGITGPPKLRYSANVGIRQAANLVAMANATEYANYATAATGIPVNAGSTSTDWYSTILRTAVEQNHSVSLSGGSDRATYFLSLGYLNDQGIVIDNAFRRFTIRSNTDFRLNAKIRVGITSSYDNGAYDGVNLGAAYNDAYRAAPIIPSKINGKYGNTSSYQNVGNPLLDIESQKNPITGNRLQGSGYIEYKPVPWLTLRSSLGGDLISFNNKTYTYAFNNDTSTFLTFGGNQRSLDSYLSIQKDNNFHWVFDNTATVNKKFGDHNLTILVGTTSEKYTDDFIQAAIKDVPSDPNLWYIDAGNQNTSQNSGSGDEWTRNSYLARVNYSYKDRYLFTSNFRADGSSRFNKNWGNFPSVGVGWIITKESFMEKQNLFSLLKLRASWGQVGNDQIPTDAHLITVTGNLPYPFSGGTATPGSAITRIKDQNIYWETTEESDLGLEFTLLENHLTGEIAVYNKKVNNALINIPIPATAGDQNNYVTTNAASIENKGLEITLNWNKKVNSEFTYHFGGNISFNKNNVTGLNGGQQIEGGSVGAQGFTTYTDVGHPVGSFYVLKVIGVFQSQAEINNYKNPDGTLIDSSAQVGDLKYAKAPVANGSPTGPIDVIKDRQFVGSYQPTAYYGINGGFTYKNFDLSIDAYGNYGNQVYNGKKAIRYSQGAIDNIEQYQAYGRWTPSNHSQTEPAANGGNLPASTYFIESGSFIRINNITIGYTLSAEALKRIKMSSIRIYVTSQNPFIYKKYSGFTPELPGSGPLDAGIETDAYPTTKTFAFGVNVGF